MEFKIGLINVLQGFTFAGQIYSESKFSGFYPSKYANFINSRNVDILCLNEVLFDDKSCNGVMLPEIKKTANLKHDKSCLNDKSWLFEDKYYGTSILSKYPITDSKEILLPNPKLETDRENGDHWIMNDKKALKTTLEIGGKLIDVITFQYFPMHHFGRKIDDAEFANIKLELAKILADDTATVVAADFNHYGVTFNKAFPELFAGGFSDSFLVPTTLVGSSEQIDHIIYKGENLKPIAGEALEMLSDHYYLEARFELK